MQTAIRARARRRQRPRIHRRHRRAARAATARSTSAPRRARRSRCWRARRRTRSPRAATSSIPDDVKALAPAVMRHRVGLQPDAEIEGVSADDCVAEILREVRVPEPSPPDRPPRMPLIPTPRLVLLALAPLLLGHRHGDRYQLPPPDAGRRRGAGAARRCSTRLLASGRAGRGHARGPGRAVGRPRQPDPPRRSDRWRGAGSTSASPTIAPPTSASRTCPPASTLAARGRATVVYHLSPSRRGAVELRRPPRPLPVAARACGSGSFACAERHVAKVYPDVAAVRVYELLARQSRENLLVRAVAPARRRERVRTPARVRARRRVPQHRLEGDRAARAADRPRVPAGAQPDGRLPARLRAPDDRRERRPRPARPRAQRRADALPRRGARRRSAGPDGVRLRACAATCRPRAGAGPPSASRTRRTTCTPAWSRPTSKARSWSCRQRLRKRGAGRAVHAGDRRRVGAGGAAPGAQPAPAPPAGVRAVSRSRPRPHGRADRRPRRRARRRAVRRGAAAETILWRERLVRDLKTGGALVLHVPPRPDHAGGDQPLSTDQGAAPAVTARPWPRTGERRPRPGAAAGARPAGRATARTRSPRPARRDDVSRPTWAMATVEHIDGPASVLVLACEAHRPAGEAASKYGLHHHLHQRRAPRTKRGARSDWDRSPARSLSSPGTAVHQKLAIGDQEPAGRPPGRMLIDDAERARVSVRARHEQAEEHGDHQRGAPRTARDAPVRSAMAASTRPVDDLAATTRFMTPMVTNECRSLQSVENQSKLIRTTVIAFASGVADL